MDHIAEFLDVNVILHFISTVDFWLNAPNRYVILHDNGVLGYTYMEWVYIYNYSLPLLSIARV